MRRIAGFTLIELIAVMVVVSIGFVGLAAMFSNMSNGLASAEAKEKTAQYAQACAEYLFQMRRDNGYSSSSLTSSMCNSLLSATDSGYAFQLTKYSSGGSTTASGMCPSGATCQDWTIKASGGGLSSSVTITLANY